MTDDRVETVDGRGRPRRFDEQTERRKLLDAALALMIRHGYDAVTVADVLTASGLSTRSFYRHFESKDALLGDLLQREVRSVSRRLEQAVADAPGPVAAVEAWIDAFLDTFYEPRRVARASAFTDRDVLAAPPMADRLGEIRGTLCASLATALRSGVEAGTFESPDPDLDAVSVYGVVTATVQGGRERRPPRANARAQILRFVHPALGVTRVE